ncbi:MAG: alanine--tRNA ligase-related protein [Eubacteriales bacterium]
MELHALYYENSHTQTFTATVLTCEPTKKGYGITLSQTAFYPEGGGQPCDLGTLDDASVLDVREVGDDIVHTCDKLLEVGTTVTGQLDWTRRFDHMQLHSGEHIISGIASQLYGYDNVGFHMGTDMVTIDFNGELTPEQVADLELRANQAVWANTPVEVLYPTPEELEAKDYRSKKALSGQVRLVEFPGSDCCACCGTHVKSTGEIGIIRLFSCAKFKGGVRIELLCGRRCMEYLQGIYDQNRQISNLLSAKPLETAAAVQRLSDAGNSAKARIAQLEEATFIQIAQGYDGAETVLHFEDGLTADGVRKLAVAIAEVAVERVAVFSGNDQDGYGYAVSHTGGDLRLWSKSMNQALNGRGGGKPEFVQGSVKATRQEVSAFFGSPSGRAGGEAD